jgi:aspartate ammonia-lyase
MKKETLESIEKAADAVRRGDYNNQFTVTGSRRCSTSTNMNANEVMANVALEMTATKKASTASSNLTIT